MKAKIIKNSDTFDCILCWFPLLLMCCFLFGIVYLLEKHEKDIYKSRQKFKQVITLTSGSGEKIFTK